MIRFLLLPVDLPCALLLYLLWRHPRVPVAFVTGCAAAMTCLEPLVFYPLNFAAVGLLFAATLFPHHLFFGPTRWLAEAIVRLVIPLEPVPAPRPRLSRRSWPAAGDVDPRGVWQPDPGQPGEVYLVCRRCGGLHTPDDVCD
ncbi:MAG: hypothetical protein K2X87_21250 [Gemmataceae bacterium]|nr:hypothetical protein [Gemmataceae bacterium]